MSAKALQVTGEHIIAGFPNDFLCILCLNFFHFIAWIFFSLCVKFISVSAWVFFVIYKINSIHIYEAFSQFGLLNLLTNQNLLRNYIWHTPLKKQWRLRHHSNKTKRKPKNLLFSFPSSRPRLMVSFYNLLSETINRKAWQCLVGERTCWPLCQDDSL